MRMTLIVLVSGFALFMSGAALANTANTSAAADATPEPMTQSTAIPQATQVVPVAALDDEHKLICQHLVHDGTVLPQQVCLTKQHWEMIRTREQNKFRDYQRHDN